MPGNTTRSIHMYFEQETLRGKTWAGNVERTRHLVHHISRP
jgi:hypothetical protein